MIQIKKMSGHCPGHFLFCQKSRVGHISNDDTFFDNFVTVLISLGYEEGWKTQLRICSVFNFVLSLLDKRWTYRIVAIFLRFYLHTLNVSIGEDCDVGDAGR